MKKKSFEEYAKGRNKLETINSYKDLISALIGHHFYMLDISEVDSFTGYGGDILFGSIEPDLCRARWKYTHSLDID